MPKIETRVALRESEHTVLAETSVFLKEMLDNIHEIGQTSSLENMKKATENLICNYKIVATEKFPIIIQMKKELEKLE